MIKDFAFPVDIDRFNDVGKTRNKVFIYFKRRKPEDLNFLKEYLQKTFRKIVIKMAILS